jgi:murein DD-endopeptidase MepM/ murein hydrolase activator NlpD
MLRRLTLPLAAVLLVAGTASAGGIGERKRAIDDRIAGLEGRIAEANSREAVLTSEISALTGRVHALEGQVAGAQARLERLERQLALHKSRLRALARLYRLQTARLKLWRRQFALAEERLNARLVAIYQSDDPSALEVVLSAASFADMLDRLDYLNELGAQDRAISRQFKAAKERVTIARARTKRTRASVARATKAIAVRASAQRAERDRLLVTQRALSAARAEKQQVLASIETSERALTREARALASVSADLAAQIRAAQAQAAVAAPAAPPPPAAPATAPPASAAPATAAPALPPPPPASSGGLIWPVSGTLTSPYGQRGGRLHAGIDIAAPTGTPIRAAASGRVISSGAMGGYGNIVVIDHGGGLATAYAHNSRNAVGAGASVAQGQVIAYIGCTGSCSGPHVHFEVRVNGSPVDPLGYLS